ncbi:MAG: EutN/CcmL family microcompartment protein [Candidatus Brocadiales bacterium]|nr:EutN/CcmL family microcompartment protein [Candidatus Brocadiales bacterium]
MILARVAGTVVATVRADGIEGSRYLLVEPCGASGETGVSVVSSGIVALDLIGAAPGELVLVSQGSSTRQTEITKDKPIDAVIIGIVDNVVESGKVVY